ncbi:MAG: LysR substrate-binding domain-containing protein, partial [Candidatus Nanopelagicales bacterium]
LPIFPRGRADGGRHRAVAHARDLIAGFSTARDAVRRIASGDRGVLRVGMVSGILSAGELVPPILTAFRERTPEVRLELHEIPFADQVTALLRDAVDVVILRGPLTDRPLACAELDIVPIAEEPRVLLVGAAHELAQEPRVRAQDVLDFPTLPLAAPASWSAFWQLDDLRGGALAGPRVPPAATASEVPVGVALHDVVVSTPSCAARLQPNPLITAIPLDDVPPAVIGIASRHGDLRAQVRTFVDGAQRAAAEHLHLLPGAALPG